MSETKHTPGPWWYEKSEDGSPSQGGEHCVYAGGNGDRYAEDCHFIAQTNYDTLSRGRDEPTFSTSEADARLIAAAPELLREMKLYLAILERAESDPDIWDSLTHGTGIATLNGFRAALAKAEGR